MQNQGDYFGMRENTYLLLMHLSQFCGYIIPGLGFIVPIVLWLVRKDQSAEVDKHGRNIANFLLSWVILYAIAGILCITIIGAIIGIPMLIVLGIAQIVFVIVAAIKANDGIYWKYPLAFQFF